MGGGTSGCVPLSPSTRGALDGWSEGTVNISTISSGHCGGDLRVRQVLDGWSEGTVNISTISSGHWEGGDLRVRQVLDGWSEGTVNISTISSGHWGGDLRVRTALPVHPGYVRC